MDKTQVQTMVSMAELLHGGLKPLEVTLPFSPELAEPRFWASREFFRGSYLTVGLRNLMVDVADRLAGAKRSGVYELDARSGCGKTHALLVLYHMTNPGISDDVPELRDLFSAASVTLPETIKRVVITDALRHPRTAMGVSDGLEIKTLWGELAWQLGGAAAYEMIADHDRAGTPLGLHLLTQLLSVYSPCLILADGLESYLCHAGPENDEKSAWAHLEFIQALSLAVRQAPQSVLVVSTSTESGSRDRNALDIRRELYAIFKFAERWRPASLEEIEEIARKRLCDGGRTGQDMRAAHPSPTKPER